MNAEDFVSKWKAVTAGERAVAQSHFIDLTALLEVPNPVQADPDGAEYAFERHVKKAARGKGFADVWKRGAFAWEYKGKGKDLGDAYRQLLLYRDDLQNPPLLVVSDIERIEIHTNFTGTNKAVYTYTLEDLLDSSKRAELKRAWTDPASFDPRRRRERITQEATHEIGRIALSLRERGHDPLKVAHFMMQLVFALFAEDTKLLPNKLVTKILQRAENPQRVQDYLSQLFHAMSTGGEVLLEDVAHFNGGLFDGADALPLSQEEIGILYKAALLDWAEVEPAIFGTLFERSLDPSKRSQLGAHYTSREDILRIVEPVIKRPLRERWNEIREAAEAHLAAPPADSKKAVAKRKQLVDAPIATFLHELHQLRTLDPASGSGNFLYVALQAMKDLEHEVVTFAEQVGAPGMRMLGPKQFYGIEINPFARELASMVVWIGYLQWNRANGISSVQTPILEPLDNIVLHDALMNEDGTEYMWPDAEFIIGNPPFLGNYKMRSELGHERTGQLYGLFEARIPNRSDLVCYWIEKARAQIEQKRSRRAGLIATNSIRGGANRVVLDRVMASGGIFEAWSDEPWILDGAAVRVSIVAFDDGSESSKVLNGEPVVSINPDLTSRTDISKAKRIRANAGKASEGVKPAGPFDITKDLAEQWIDLPNPSGVSNRDVLKAYIGGRDITQKPSNRWIIDFNQMPKAEAQQYVVPFRYVEERVQPIRATNKRAHRREAWWLFGESYPHMRSALKPLDRYIAISAVSKHRVFVWIPRHYLPANSLITISADDDFTFGVLHSKIHEVWSLAQGTSLEDRPRYTPSTGFETFPFPNQCDEQRERIASAAKHLDAIRGHLLAADSRLTMTKLYNEVDALKTHSDSAARAFPLVIAHEELDKAVTAAYGWEWPLSDDEILERLLALNLKRAAEESDQAAMVVAAAK